MDMSDIKPNTIAEEKSIPDTTAADTEVARLETVVDNLDVSKSALESDHEGQQKNVYEGDGDSSTTSDDDREPPKELGYVISALQSTVKQNQIKEQATVEDQNTKGEQEQTTKEENEQTIKEENEQTTKEENNQMIKEEHEQTIKEEHEQSIKEEHEQTTKEEQEQKATVVEEELRSVGDNDKSSVDDNNSVTTSSSTNVSQEEEKMVEEADIPSTFEKIVQDVLPPTPGVAPQRQTFDLGGRGSEEMGDVESYSANLIALNKINTKEIKANELSPRQQERAGNYSRYLLYIVIYQS
jgi:flagellar biosynthesis GTPase FlhF